MTKKMVKSKIKMKNLNSNKRISKRLYSSILTKYNNFADDRITQYMHQIAWIYIIVRQQKRYDTYLKLNIN